MAMKADSLNVATSFMPKHNWADIQWMSYHLQMEEALYDATHNQPVDPRARKELRRIDSIIEMSMKDIPAYLGEKKDYDTRIHLGEGEFPSRYEIYRKWMDLVINRCNEAGVERNDTDLQYKIAANTTADCQRVIKRMINQEPLELIPEEVSTFERFVARLSRPSDDMYSREMNPCKRY